MDALINSIQYLAGNKFVVKTDHNCLRYFLTQKYLNERKQKWVSKIQAFDFDIEYVRERIMWYSNSLSRIPSIFLKDVAGNWKATLEVEYAKDKFPCEIFDGTNIDDSIRYWKESSTTNVEYIWSLIQV